MGETTIEWCDFTFNPWIGCTKVSSACKNCYAEVDTFARVQRSKGRELWGVNAERHKTGADNWRKPKRWNEQAKAEGVRRRVFCASLADVFEDKPELEPWRDELFQLIDQTPHLDWLLLTKRPENVRRLWPFGWYDEQFSWPTVWVGTTVENQEEAGRRIPHLLNIPAAVRFLSCEPLLGPIDLHSIIALDGDGPDSNLYWIGQDARIDWVICGGESGPNARPMDIKWARSLRDQCIAAKVPFHFKQWGEYHPQWCDGKERLGKARAGRRLDGRTWDEFPLYREAA